MQDMLQVCVLRNAWCAAHYRAERQDAPEPFQEGADRHPPGFDPPPALMVTTAVLMTAAKVGEWLSYSVRELRPPVRERRVTTATIDASQLPGTESVLQVRRMDDGFVVTVVRLMRAVTAKVDPDRPIQLGELIGTVFSRDAAPTVGVPESYAFDGHADAIKFCQAWLAQHRPSAAAPG